MVPSGADTVLIRHRELGVKSSSVQRRMEQTLVRNLEDMLTFRDIPGDVSRVHGRLFIRTEEAAIEPATDAATVTFGVASASPAVSVPARQDAIEAGLADLAEQAYHGGSFAVRARRAGPRSAHGFTSMDLERTGGDAVWSAVSGSFDPTVDLDQPDVTFYVECREDRAYLYLEHVEGPSGFPLGTQGRVVALISGGIDSPVAAWEMMRRGCEITPIYFDFEDYGGPDHVARALESVRHLTAFAPGREIQCHRAPIGPAVEELLAEVENTRMVSLRRLMFAVAERIAEGVDAHGLVTGEALGQKSSQTGANMSVASAELTVPIYRPLLTWDKQTIIAKARDIGTYEEATIDAGCNRVAPTHPATHARREQVSAAEPTGFMDHVEEIIARTEPISIEPERPSRPVVASG